VYLPTFAVRVVHEELSAAQLARAWRRSEPPVFARIQDEALLLDPRTLLPGDSERLLESARRIVGRRGTDPAGP
jgi:L-seryl-tRNA(Ser) seleniumtransferase